eukprot:TRINITY_DN12306_c0_g1_i1.p1 TRINITY_DN12306_c0_g1~~TRINITY_DN12306_c0_g1_i1.p1  ORF type:complete len:598 (+),score=104.39 TRINITY_DN12306_c0_g1_i1:29-1822(+)
MKTSKSITIPISVMITLITTTISMLVLAIVITDMDSNMRSALEDLSQELRVQSLRSVQATLLGIIDGLHGSLNRKAISDMAVAKMKTDLGQMELGHGVLVLLLDRNAPNKILVSSNNALQQERVRVDEKKMLHPWIASILDTNPNWTEGMFEARNALKLNTPRGKINVNMVSVDYFSVHGERDMSFLVVYIIPEDVLMNKADTSREVSLNYATLISNVAIVIVVACTVTITSPLAKLAIDLELVRCMHFDNLQSSSSSRLMEIDSLLIGFKEMCDIFIEYKAFMPKTVFVESDNGTEPSTVIGSGGDSFSSKSDSYIARTTLTEVNKMRDMNGAILLFRLHEAEKFMCLPDASHKVATIMEVLEACCSSYHGTLHPMSIRSPSEFSLSWGLVVSDYEALKRAAGCSFSIRSDLMIGINFAVSVVASKTKVGNLGTVGTRGFAISGSICYTLQQLAMVGDELSYYSTCVLADEVTSDRLTEYSKVPVELISDATGNRKITIWELKLSFEVNIREWMYELQQIESRNTSTLRTGFDFILKGKMEEALALLRTVATPDYSEQFVMKNLANRIAVGAESFEAVPGMMPARINIESPLTTSS